MLTRIIACLFVLLIAVNQLIAQEEGLRDVRGPVAYPENPWVGRLISFAIVSAMAVGFYLFLQYCKKRSTPEQEPPKPWEIALAKIRLLRARKTDQPGDLQEFYSELSDILREYIENQFSIPAVEMTTEEFLMSLKNNNDLSGDHKKLLKQFLHNADMVKFAKFTPSEKDTEEGYEVAKKFISQTQGGDSN